MADKNDIHNFVAGLLIGGIVGAGIALLFAPASGKETRAYISDSATKVVKGGKEKIERIRGAINEEVSKMSENREKLKEAFKAGVDTYKHNRSEEETA
jgi:gas vesicle protein